jgi:hypothetical protein
MLARVAKRYDAEIKEAPCTSESTLALSSFPSTLTAAQAKLLSVHQTLYGGNLTTQYGNVVVEEASESKRWSPLSRLLFSLGVGVVVGAIFAAVVSAVSWLL